jgi:DNA mismatch repair protein MutH
VTDTSDRELLERAAKAAGLDLAWSSTDGQSPRNKADWNVWNPLTDDGDALRLAVKLGIAIQLHPAWVYARAVMPNDHYQWMEITEGWGNTKDPNAATRRAIVRAAAAIPEDTP